MQIGKIGIGWMATVAGVLLAGGSASAAADPGFTQTFPACSSFSSTGANRYMVLAPGWQLVLTGEDEGEQIELVITALAETQVVDGVTTRIIEERESVDGELAEVSRNFFARCLDHNGIFYFGEEVDFYENGVIVGHEGAWESGVDGARFGLMMPGLALLGSRYFQEIAPDVALDKGEIVKLGKTKTVPAGTFTDCVKVRETNDLEPGQVEGKVHAPGVGLIKDGPLTLESYGFVD